MAHEVERALRFGEINLFTSGLITGESRILYVRDIRARVELLAPFLDFDSDPYPVIVDGRRPKLGRVPSLGENDAALRREFGSAHATSDSSR